MASKSGVLLTGDIWGVQGSLPCYIYADLRKENCESLGVGTKALAGAAIKSQDVCSQES